MKQQVDSYDGLKSALRRLALMVLLAFGSAITAHAGTHPPAPAAPFTTTAGKTLSTATLQGRPTLLWLLSTWCGSCAAGLQTLARHAGVLQKAGLRIVVLRNYRNDGYPGMHIGQFVSEVLPHFTPPQNWILGQASRQLGKRYNAKHYPDIYFLIDAKGRIQAVDSAPSATLKKILSFAKNPSNG